MAKLLSSFENAPLKKAYQTYTVKHGIERLSILVPLTEAVAFEQKFSALGTKDKASIIQLVEGCGGKVRG